MAGIPNNRFVIKERREQVSIFLSQSITEIEIARRLKVDQSTVSRDVKQIKKESQRVIENIAKETLPFEFGRCLSSLGRVAKECWNIFDDKSEKWTNKDKINALKLIKETERTKFEVLLQGPTNLYIQELNDKLQAFTENNESNPIDYFRLPAFESKSQEDLR